MSQHASARSWPEFLAATAGYAALAIILLDPMFAHPSRTVVNEVAVPNAGWLVAPDVNLIMWILSWDWHALTTEPRLLFDANIFHPAPLALASSEHMLGHLTIFGPIYAITHNPVLANQLNVLLCIALSGAAMYALLRHWGTGVAAAAFAGFVYALFPARVYALGHAQLLGIQYLPLAFLFLDRTLTGARVSDAAALAVFTTVEVLTSYYVAYMAAVVIGAYGLAALVAGRRRISLRGVALAAAAGLVAAGVLAALSGPYFRLAHEGLVPNNVDSFWAHVGRADLWRCYLVPPALWRRPGAPVLESMPLYVGLIALACVIAAVVPRRRRPDPGGSPCPWAVPAALTSALACYLMALGPDVSVGSWRITLPYGVASQYVPGFSALRIPARFGIAMMAGFSALAGLGLQRVLDRLPSRPSLRWLPIAVLCVLTTGTAYEYGLFAYRPEMREVDIGPQLPPVYSRLAELPPGPVLEIPANPPDLSRGFIESQYMLYSTFHWHPLLNGYSGYPPPSYDLAMSLASALPDDRAVEILARATGLRYVVVHEAKLAPLDRRRWADAPGLELLGRYGTDLLFEVAGSWPADLVERMIDFRPATHTVLGTPLVPLPSEGRHATLALTGPELRGGLVGRPLKVEVEVENTSGATWPVIAPVGDHRLAIAYRWEGANGEVVVNGTSPLPYDLRPGESVRAVVGSWPPRAAGTYRLFIGVAQDGEWFDEPLGPIAVDIGRPYGFLRGG